MGAPHRLAWLFTQCPIYYITACTHKRHRILDRPAVHEAFIQFALCAPQYGVCIGRYVIMPDHTHLFAAFEPDSISLGNWSPDKGEFSGPALATGLLRSRPRSEESY